MNTYWMIVDIFILFKSSFEVVLCTQIKQNIENAILQRKGETLRV